jgi:hypothetical protein
VTVAITVVWHDVQDHKCTFHDDDDDIMDEDRRSAYSNMPTNKRLTMKYDMGALKKIGEYEDALREKLGVVFKCDPDELPIDLDLNEIYALEPQDRQGALVSTDLMLSMSTFPTILCDFPCRFCL